MLRDLLLIVLASVLIGAVAFAGWSVYKDRYDQPEPAAQVAPQAPESPSRFTPSMPAQEQIVVEQQQPSLIQEDQTQSQPALSQVGQDEGILLQALALFSQKDYHGAIRALEGIQTAEAMMLRGSSYCELESHYLCTVELERAIASGIGSKEAAIAVETRLSHAYYKLDEIAKSYAHANVVMSGAPDESFIQFYRKLEREHGAVKDSHIQESSDHFKVVFDGYEHGSIDRTVLSILESAYSEIGQRLDYYPRQSVTVVLNTTQEFYDVTRSPSWAGGLYDGKIRIPVRNIENFGQGEIRRILYHEYVHALVHTIVERAPHWVNEGLAEYLTQSQGPKPLGQVFPLSALERGFPAGDVRSVAISYNESHEAVKYLVDRYGMYAFMSFLRELGAGKGIHDAFESAYIISYEEFLASWGKKTG